MDANLVNVLGLVNASADVLEAEAQVNSVSGACVLSNSSSVASAVIQGTPITLLTTPLDVPILNILGINIATLHLNATLHPNSSTVTQRALWLEVTDKTLQPIVADVVVGEATADFAGGTSRAHCPGAISKPTRKAKTKEGRG